MEQRRGDRSRGRNAGMGEKTKNILDHRRTFQAQPPPVHPHVLGQTHWLQHLRTEHAAVADLHPLIQPLVKPKHLQARLRIGVVRRLESEPVDPHFREEDLHEADQASEGEPEVSDDAFDLVELGQMRSVDAFVAEHAVDGEVPRRARVSSKFVEHVA